MSIHQSFGRLRFAFLRCWYSSYVIVNALISESSSLQVCQNFNMLKTVPHHDEVGHFPTYVLSMNNAVNSGYFPNK